MIYLDHMATTPLDPAVISAMAPWVDGRKFGNPHSIMNAAGRAAEQAVEDAVSAVAALIGAKPSEVVFTSGATESNNLALIGATDIGDHIITSAAEHPAVLAVAKHLATVGRSLTVLDVDTNARVMAEAVMSAMTPRTKLVSIMAANNETGSYQPISAIARICAEKAVLFHTDATQVLTTAQLDVREQKIDLLSLSAHKLYGPQGIGALFLREGVELQPLFLGGGQQTDRRSGTVPVALAVGLGAACRVALEQRNMEHTRLIKLRERLWDGLRAKITGIKRTIPAKLSLAGCLHVTIPGLDAAEILLEQPEIAASTGSACAAGGQSPVLKAMGLHPRESFGALRFGLGRFTTRDEIDRAVNMLADAANASIGRRAAAE